MHVCVPGNDSLCVFMFSDTRLENVQRTTRFGLRPCTHSSGGEEDGAAYTMVLFGVLL